MDLPVGSTPGERFADTHVLINQHMFHFYLLAP